MDKINQLEINSSRILKASSKIRETINELLDENSFVETDVFMSGSSFISGEDALGEGVVTGYGLIDGKPIYLFAQNKEVLGGSVGKAHAQKIIKCMQSAIKTGTPFISIIDSQGVRVGEGIGAIEAYSDLIANGIAVASSVPHIAIIKGYCVGMMATYASVADYVIATPDSVISLNPPTVVTAKANINGKLSDSLGAKGHKSSLISFIAKNDSEIKKTILSILNTVSVDELEPTDDPNRITASLNKGVTADKLLKAVCDDGKYTSIYDTIAKEVVCAFTAINGIKVGVVASNPAVSEYLSVEGMDKIINFVKSIDNIGLPLITFVNFKGVDTCLSCELEGAGIKSAQLFYEIQSSSVPKISVITGNAIGFAYAALASKAIGFDYSFATSDAIISPILPEIASNLFAEEVKASKDPIATKAAIEKKYAEDSCNPFVATKDGYIDNIIEPANIRPYLASALMMLVGA